MSDRPDSNEQLARALQPELERAGWTLSLGSVSAVLEALDFHRRASETPAERREYHANGTYWSGVPTMDMPCDFCARPFVDHDPRTHACLPVDAWDRMFDAWVKHQAGLPSDVPLWPNPEWPQDVAMVAHALAQRVKTSGMEAGTGIEPVRSGI